VYDWLLTVARERDVDAIVLAGDLFGCLDGFDTPEAAQRHEASLLTGLLQGAGLPVLYVMGNDAASRLWTLCIRWLSIFPAIHGRQV
jgi:DNA repair exonuclease SbcCD nuclease subunit